MLAAKALKGKAKAWRGKTRAVKVNVKKVEGESPPEM